MQVARALKPGKRNYLNKTLEMFRAFQLEWKLSKDEILQLYLNLIPYGGNIEGVKAASYVYFKKSPDHLSLAEIVALSIIPNRPSSLVMGKHNDRILTERNRWLQRFRPKKIFTNAELNDALSEPLTATRGALPQLAPQLSLSLLKQNQYLVETTIDLNTQLKTEKLVSDYIRGLYLKKIRNAAVIILDNKTHEIISYVGSANFRDTIDAGQVNGAAAIREPGSTLKPLLYALAIDAGLMTPKMVLTDAAINYNGYAPENYDKHFNGYVTMDYALGHSLNIPAVKTLSLLGRDRLIQELSDCNFKQIRKDQQKLGLSMVLGGCGATLEELTGMYSVFANDGNFLPATVLKKSGFRRAVRILSPASTFMVNEVLSQVNRPDFPLNWQSTERMPKIAWKTGTSYGRRDGWSIGYNKRFTVGVWTGNFSGEGNAELSGASVATPLLFQIFNTIDYDSDDEWFSQPADCDSRIVCTDSGLPPSPECKNRSLDYFIPLVSSSNICELDREVLLSADGRISYCQSCLPQSGYKKKRIKFISPEMQQFYDDQQIAYEKIPPHNPSCQKIFQEGVPVITFPSDNAEYLINTRNREPLSLTCRTAADVTTVYWYINDRFYKSSPAREKQFFIPEAGPVKISCTDDKGRNKNITIQVRYVSL
jgi:penicillin-binding protein 1C